MYYHWHKFGPFGGIIQKSCISLASEMLFIYYSDYICTLYCKRLHISTSYLLPQCCFYDVSCQPSMLYRFRSRNALTAVFLTLLQQCKQLKIIPFFNGLPIKQFLNRGLSTPNTQYNPSSDSQEIRAGNRNTSSLYTITAH